MWIWNLLVDFFAPLGTWTGLLAAVAVAAGVVGFYLPVFRQLAFTVAAVCAFGALMYWMGDQNGADRVNTRWRTAVETEQQNGEKARQDAERVVARDTPDRVLRDPRNRDNWGTKPSSGTTSKVRRLARP